MENSLKLEIEKSELTQEMRTLLESGKVEEFEKLKPRIQELEKRIIDLKFIEMAERDTATHSDMDGEDRNWEKRTQNFSLSRAIAAASGFGNIDAGSEIEISTELCHRLGASQGIRVPRQAFYKRSASISTSKPTGHTGANLIGTDFRGDLYIDLLRDASVLERLGITHLTGLVGNVDIPKGVSGTTAAWIAEDSAITASAAGFGKISLTPKHVAAMTEISRNMILQTSCEEIVQRDLAVQIAGALDAAALVGTGTNNQPTGILNTSGIGSVYMGTNGGSLTWSKVLEMEKTADDAFCIPSGWVTNAAVVGAMRSTLKTSGDAGTGFIAESRTMLDGLPLFSTGHIPQDFVKGTSNACSALILGNWAEMILGEWGTIEILVNPYASDAYSRGNIAVRAITTCDVAVRHPESFVACEDITTA